MHSWLSSMFNICTSNGHNAVQLLTLFSHCRILSFPQGPRKPWSSLTCTQVTHTKPRWVALYLGTMHEHASKCAASKCAASKCAASKCAASKVTCTAACAACSMYTHQWTRRSKVAHLVRSLQDTLLPPRAQKALVQPHLHPSHPHRAQVGCFVPWQPA